MSWESEFGKEYAVPELIDGDPGLYDMSWHNDVCPSFCLLGQEEGEDTPRLWVEHPSAAEREFGTKRFTVDMDGGGYFETDDPAAAVRALKREPARVPVAQRPTFSVEVEAVMPEELKMGALLSIEVLEDIAHCGALVRLTASSRSILEEYIAENWGDREYALDSLYPHRATR